MNNDRDQDALFEALTIDRHFSQPMRPKYYHSGILWDDWWGKQSGKPDVVYCKPERNEKGDIILHRIYGPAYISFKYDIEAWYKDGELHCEDGPAYRHKNNKYWYIDGKLHRLDGPAVDAKGHPKEYWINGNRLPPKEYKKEIERRKRKGLIK